MTNTTNAEVARLLERGASADIWYDASAHNDDHIAQLIEDVQQAMVTAARIIRSLPKE